MALETKLVRVNSWQTRARKGGIYLAVVASLASTQIACGGSSEPEWETVTEQVPTKGVIQTVEEVSGGKYEIVDEQTVANPSDSRIIIKRLSGEIDTITLEQAKMLVGSQDTAVQNITNNHYHSGGGMGLGSVIWWGAMGYMMGRSFSTPVQPYAYRQAPSTPPNMKQEERRDRPTTSSGGGSTYRGYASGSKAADELRSTTTTRSVQRPVSGKSGYFGGSSRTSSGS